MTQKDNILQELIELQSSLAGSAIQNAYRVPAGYFNGLAEQALRRVKALEATNAPDEIKILSPFLNNVPKQMPYAMPDGYFEHLTENAAALIKVSSQTSSEELEHLSAFLHGISKQTPYAVPARYFENIAEAAVAVNREESPSEELEKISPLLSSLKKETPYSLPANFFEKIDTIVAAETKSRPAKVISITSRKWFRYAAAAVVIGFAVTTGFLLTGKKDTIDPNTQSAEWVNKSLKKVSTDDIDHFVEDAALVAVVDAKNESKDKNDVKELIKDIPDKDIQSFLDDAQADNSENDDALMN